MNKLDFFRAIVKTKAIYRKDWVISAFSVTRPPADAKPYHGMISYTRDATQVYFENQWVTIDDHAPMTALFIPAIPLTVTPEDCPSLTKTVDSTVGDLLFNWRVLMYAFGAKFPYQVGPVSIRKVESIIAGCMIDTPPEGTPVPDDKISVAEYMRFGRAMTNLAGFTQLFVPAGSPKALTTDPRIKEVRAMLLEKYKDRLHDPAVVAEIQNILIEMDKAWLKGDPAEGFYFTSKSYNTARKRMFLIHGPEAGFDEGGSAELVVNSLNEGWDIEKFPAMMNSLRAGSYFRGALTALGGESVKFFMRVFQNTRISEEDCGSTMGVFRYIDPGSLDYYEGLWQMTKDGLVELTPERLEQIKGTFVMTRSPQYCKTDHTDFCAKCCGRRLAVNPDSPPSETAAVGSTFMQIMMASAHAKELKTARLRVDQFLT